MDIYPKPDWFNSRGERARAAEIVPFDPLEKYRILAAGIYQWEGLPDDVPDGYIERVLFDTGKVSAKIVNAVTYILPVHTKTYGIYGETISWLPSVVNSTANLIPELKEPSDNPVLEIGEPIARMVRLYAHILHDSLISLRQNVIALRQPIAIYGNPGNSANGIVLKNELDNGDIYLPLIERSGVDIEAIDLKAKDYTQALISVHNAMDNEILTALGIKNTGIEKASGVTSEETTALHQELQIASDKGLKLRQKWCEKINDRLGTNFSVRISDAYIVKEPEPEPEPLAGDASD